MPNHITNILTITGSEAEVRKCLESIRGIEDEQYMDFNKIIPMPESLNITSGSSVESAIDIIQNNTKKFEMMMEYHWVKEQGIKSIEELKESIKSRLTQKDFDEALKAIDNEIKYGCRDWYSWSNLHWGTKWNAYDQILENDDTIIFDTAWASPYPVMEKLAQMFPSLHFCVKYADDDLGHNCGVYEFDGGTCIGVYQPKNKEALKFACEVKKIDFKELVSDSFSDWEIKDLKEVKETLIEMLRDGYLPGLINSVDIESDEGMKKVKYIENLCIENELYEELIEFKSLLHKE